MRLAADDVHRLFGSHPALVATCRPGDRPDAERQRLLVGAVEAGARFVDVELESDTGYRTEIVASARSRGCRVIVSFHDYEKTPGKAVLDGLVSACFEAGADIAKIACLVRSPRDSARLLSLLDTDKDVVVAGMGEHGRVTRIVAPLLGSPFTYASLSRAKETADGQIDIATLSELMKKIGEVVSEK
jgi:3-dehydroquinate dehydratase-1